MAKKVKTELELEEVLVEKNPVSHTTSHDFLQKYKMPLFAIGGVLLLAAGYFGWSAFRNSGTEEAGNASYNAVYYWEKDSLKKSLDGDGVNMGLKEIASSYSGNAIGNQAKYMAGIAALKDGKPEEAIEYLESFSKGDNLVSASAYMALGFANEDLGKQAEAASFFEKAAGMYGEKDDQLRPTLLKLAGEAYEAAGNKSKALGIYNTIKDKYPNSEEGKVIDKYIGRAE
jgi:tetratricopeptide (TPR) repeat protein